MEGMLCSDSDLRFVGRLIGEVRGHEVSANQALERIPRRGPDGGGIHGVGTGC